MGVVVSILALIYALFFIGDRSSGELTPEKLTFRRLQALTFKSYQFLSDAGRFPEESKWADELVGSVLNSPRAAEPFFDAWEQPFRYRIAEDGSTVYIHSIGPNGIDELGACDDIGNWVGSRPEYDAYWKRTREALREDYHAD